VSALHVELVSQLLLEVGLHLAAFDVLDDDF
jgi:hypothetical protein